MKGMRLSDDVRTIPLVHVTGRMHSAEEGQKRSIHEKIYGKEDRRQAVTKLRKKLDGECRDRMLQLAKPRCCALQDIFVSHVAKIHEPILVGGLQATKPKIAPANHNVSLVKLDVEKVGLSSTATMNAKRVAHNGSGSRVNGVIFGQVGAGNLSNSKVRSASDEGMKSDVNRIRGYMDLLDEYSLHHFIIWQGKVIRDTPEFTSLARTHQACWSSIDRCVVILEEIMTVNAVPLAVIDGKQLGDLAKFDLERMDEADLCSCIANLEQIRPLLRHIRLVSNRPSVATLAAVTIQAAARRFLERSEFLILKRQRNAALRLQCLARGTRSRRLVGALLRGRQRDAESQWQKLQAELKTRWESWRERERVIILLPFSITGDNARGIQISRMHFLVDPKVHVVCVLTSQPDKEVLEYHAKTLEMSGIYNARGRMTFVVPENVELFHNRLTLASLLLYSPGCLKRIIQIVKSRPATILSSEVGWQYKRLAVALRAPLLSAEPSVAALLETQSGMKRVFTAADVSAPIGAHDVFDEEDLMVSLTKLIASNLDVRRWHIKVDVCRNNRGLAILDTSTVACMASLKREKAQLERANGGSSGVWHHPDVQLLARAKLLKTLRRCLHRVISICNSAAHPTWTHFLVHLAQVGGVIEAEATEMQGNPSTSVFISPTGKLTFLSETEMLFDACYQHVGCTYPQECVSPQALRGASAAVSRELFLRGVMGYVSIYFVVFWSEHLEAPRLWATGLELGLSASAFSFCLFRSLTAGEGRDLGFYEEPGNGSNSGSEGPLLRYVFLDHLQHPSLRSMQIPVFFKLCRLEGISFDLGTQIGTIFNLVDSLACGIVGMLTIAKSTRGALEKALGGLKFIRRLAKERLISASGQVEPLSKETWSLTRFLQRQRINQDRNTKQHRRIEGLRATLERCK